MSEVPFISDVAAARPAAHAGAAAHARPAAPMRRVRQVGYTILGLQLALALAWSTVQYDRFALTFDFTIFHQAWYLIAHGNLNPWSTIKLSYFWQDHSEFIMWPLALLYWVWPHSVVLLWSRISLWWGRGSRLHWLANWPRGGGKARKRDGLACCGLVLLWRTRGYGGRSPGISTARRRDALRRPARRDLFSGPRRAWVWVVPLLACGDVAATYLAAIGLGVLLASARRWRARGLVLAVSAWRRSVMITLVHGNLVRVKGFSLRILTGAAASTHHLVLGTLVKGILCTPQE